VPDTITEIVFSQFQQPGLKDGTHTIKATLTLTTSAPNAPTFTSVQKVLQVGGDVPSIPADAVVSVFPPEGTSGEYSGCLAHVLLQYPKLPWQRDVKYGVNEAMPWLAVLLITDEELKEKARTGRVLQNSAGQNVLALEPAFFRDIAPTLDDLTWLAHVRKVDTVNKVDSTTTEIDYAVVVGNRLPTPGMNANAYLVSLAGLGGALTGDATPVHIEVLVFHSWRFFCTGDARTFADVMSALNGGFTDPFSDPPTLNLPYPKGSTDAGDNLLAMGYVPMPHALRVGGGTVSWYRGPLVPYGTARQIATLPVPAADAVSFYDPTIGMMDASCASAWTLGRLLALNSGSFALTLYNWKRATQRTTIEQIIYELDTGNPAPSARVSLARRADAESRLAAKLPAALETLGGLQSSASAAARDSAAEENSRHSHRRRVTHSARARALREAMHDPNKIRALHRLADETSGAGAGKAMLAADDDSNQDPLKQIWNSLADLTLLKGVPFHYLAPDQRLLPAESIRFFQIDQSWLESLLDGALSLGRITEADASHDTAFAATLREGAVRAAARKRAQRRGAVEAAQDDPPAPSAPPPPRPASGFLLRSSAVTGWPGVEVVATAGGSPATILRMEATGTIMIGLFDRVVDTLIFRQPSEGVHFGFDVIDPSGKQPILSKKRRLLTDDGDKQAGSEIDADPLTAVFYRDATASVLDINGLANWFMTSFSLQPAQFTSAEFALEMVTGVQQVTFTLS
jgi:hypothetical protein